MLAPSPRLRVRAVQHIPPVDTCNAACSPVHTHANPQGAATSLYLASSPEAEGITGGCTRLFVSVCLCLCTCVSEHKETRMPARGQCGVYVRICVCVCVCVPSRTESSPVPLCVFPDMRPTHPSKPPAGKYWVKSKRAVSSNDSYNRQVAQRLWEVSEELVETALAKARSAPAAAAPALEPATVSA